MSEVGRPIGVAVLILKDDKLLMGRRRGGYMPGTMGLPGGRIERGEGIKEAVYRELKEEVGIRPLEFNFLGVVRNDQRDSVFVHFIFVCVKFEGEIKNLEPEMCDGWDWFDFIDLPENILPGHKAGIQMYLDGEEFKDLY